MSRCGFEVAGDDAAHVWRRTVFVPVFANRIFAIGRADVRLERVPLLTLESVESTYGSEGP